MAKADAAVLMQHTFQCCLLLFFTLNPLTPELNPSKQRCLLEFLLGLLNFNAYY
jgi:hypothetical protein